MKYAIRTCLAATVGLACVAVVATSKITDVNLYVAPNATDLAVETQALWLGDFPSEAHCNRVADISAAYANAYFWCETSTFARWEIIFH